MSVRTAPGTRGRRLRPAAALTAVALGGCLAVAGCGSSHPARSARSNGRAGAHFATDDHVSVHVKAQLRTMHSQVLARLHSPAAQNKPGIARYLPRSTTKINQTVTATLSHPQLAIAGDSVELHLAGGQALATMNGPLYNNKYVGTNDPTVPAQFLLTFTRTHGAIPLAPKDFTVLDQQGNNIVPRIRARGGAAMPKQLRAGHPLTLVMSTTIAAGDGSIVYNPTGFVKSGHLPLAGWDFIVEDD